jgi:hypothetical protein
MEAKHTPGPWIQVFRADNKTMQRYIVNETGVTGFPVYIATVESETDHPRNSYRAPGLEAEANARLLAAAPELLEALEHMVAVSNWATTIQSEEQYDEMIASAEAAIRKAKGE